MTRRKTGQPQTALPKTRQRKKLSQVGGPEPKPGSDRTSVTFYLQPELRTRTRAAYRATASLEGDSSWSDLVRKALVAEVARRERRHNEGIAFAGDSLPLPPGRPATEG